MSKLILNKKTLIKSFELQKQAKNKLGKIKSFKEMVKGYQNRDLSNGLEDITKLFEMNIKKTLCYNQKKLLIPILKAYLENPTVFYNKHYITNVVFDKFKRDLKRHGINAKWCSSYKKMASILGYSHYEGDFDINLFFDDKRYHRFQESRRFNKKLTIELYFKERAEDNVGDIVMRYLYGGLPC